MKKILFVTNLNLDKAGVQTVMMNIIKNLNSKYIFDILMFSNDKSYYDDEFLSLGGKIFRIPGAEKSLWAKTDYYFRMQKVYQSTFRIIKENGPYDAIHCHNEYEAGICLAAAKEAKVPVRIVHTHVIHSKSHIVSRMYDILYKKIIEKYSTHKIGCSKEACEAFYKIHNDAIVINNPYDNKNFFFEKFFDREFLNPNLLQIGSFSDNKNQLFSIDVIDEIKKEYPEAKLKLVGFDLGNILCDINKKIEEKKLFKNVEIYSCDADISNLLSQTSTLIFPSKKEGFGIVAIEAQAMGVKCFVSDSIPKLIDCGGCEFISLSKGPEVWAKRIIEDFKKTKGKHNSYDCSAFSAENVAKIYDEIYGGRKLENWYSNISQSK